MAQKTYSELLLDPRWVCVRTKVLSRDKYKCTACESKKNLQVHHTYYYKQRDNPWNYPTESLVTLCASCHEGYHQICEIEIRQNPKHTGKKKKKRIKKARRKTKTDLLSVKSKKQRSYYSKKFPYLAKLQAEQGIRVKKKNGDIILIPNKIQLPGI